MSLLVKHLPQNASLVGLKLKTKNNVIGFYVSSSNGIVFFSDNPNGYVEGSRLYPQIIVKEEIIMNWEVIQDSRVVPNCQILTDLRHTLNE